MTNTKDLPSQRRLERHWLAIYNKCMVETSFHFLFKASFFNKRHVTLYAVKFHCLTIYWRHFWSYSKREKNMEISIFVWGVEIHIGTYNKYSRKAFYSERTIWKIWYPYLKWFQVAIWQNWRQKIRVNYFDVFYFAICTMKSVDFWRMVEISIGVECSIQCRVLAW